VITSVEAVRSSGALEARDGARLTRPVPSSVPPRFPTGSACGAAITRRPAAAARLQSLAAAWPVGGLSGGASHVSAGAAGRRMEGCRPGPVRRFEADDSVAGGGLVSASAFAFGSQDGVAGVARARGSGRGGQVAARPRHPPGDVAVGADGASGFTVPPVTASQIPLRISHQAGPGTVPPRALFR